MQKTSHLVKAGFLSSRLSPEAKAATGHVKRRFFVVFVVRVEMWEHRVWGPWTVYLISSFWKNFDFGAFATDFCGRFWCQNSPCTNLQFLCNKPRTYEIRPGFESKEQNCHTVASIYIAISVLHQYLPQCCCIFKLILVNLSKKEIER